jgi:hypothetical protein
VDARDCLLDYSMEREERSSIRFAQRLVVEKELTRDIRFLTGARRKGTITWETGILTKSISEDSQPMRDLLDGDDERRGVSRTVVASTGRAYHSTLAVSRCGIGRAEVNNLNITRGDSRP